MIGQKNLYKNVPDYFHIGYPRTGTTFLQKGIWPQLSSEIYQPKSRVGEIYRAKYRHELEAVYTGISGHTIDQRIFLDSEEEFSGDLFHDFLDIPEKLATINPKAKIIICLRSQITIIPSLYYLYIKKGNTLDYSAYVKRITANNKFDYFSIVSRYIEVFGKDNVLVMLFEDLNNAREEYINEILTFMNISKSVNCQADPSIKNTRLSPLHIRILRLTNRLVCTKSPTRYMLENDRNEAIKRLRVRTRVATIPFLFANKINKLKNVTTFELPLDKTNNLILQTYRKNNIKLFNSLDKDINVYGYPGAD